MKDTSSQNIIIYPVPKASYSINDSSQCLHVNNFLFSGQSTISQVQ